MAVTIRDVAREAGTTISTVSKAMNNSHTISGEMTAHVKAVAERMGYRPNARAQTFARRACREVAFLTRLPRDIAFTNPHMFEILVGTEAALVAKGYAIKLHGCDEDTVCALVKDLIGGKLADGLLLHVSVVTRELAVLLMRLEAPHIVIGKPNFNNSLCWIDNNNKLAGELAAGHLYDTGHRTIAFIGGREEDRISQDRLEGVKMLWKEHRHTLDAAHILQGESTVESGVEMTRMLMASDNRPSAIICANNALAFGCLRALQISGIDVPAELSLMTFDDYPLAQLTAPPLTTVSIDVYEMGVSAGKLLVNKIKKPEIQVQTFTTMPRLIMRESTVKSRT
ncbi:MAG: LacI family transcriptional regulator [Oscillospiraceae bacterium]|nr:LacI family transcriptional regulator [Oscillospiraceae bacterium]